MCRGSDPGVRLIACDCIAKVVSGLGGSDRSSASIQTDAYKCVIRLAKENGSADVSSYRIQLAATKVLRFDLYTPNKESWLLDWLSLTSAYEL